MTLVSKIGLCVIYHPFEENADKAPEIFKRSQKLMESIEGIQVIPALQLVFDIASAHKIGEQFKKEEVDVVCVKLATWSSDNLVLDMNAICQVPFIFWTYPHIHAGSLCGGQQFNMVFKELEKECIFVYKDDIEALEKIECYAKCVALRNKLKLITFGRIGTRTQGMAEVACDEFSIREIIGPRVITIGFDDFIKIRNKIDDKKSQSAWEKIQKKVAKVSVKDVEGILAMKTYFSLKKWMESEYLSGITAECYPNHMGEFCLGYSLLADESIPGACEGDINSLIMMYILMNLSGQPVHNIDPLYLYEEDNSLLGSHCGCGSFSLAISENDIELANVRLAKKGLCVIFPSKPGKITMVNLVGRRGTYRMGVIEGEAIEPGTEFPGNPIRIKLPIEINEFLEVVEETALGHHWIIAYGSYKDHLRRIASFWGIDFISL